MVEICMVILQGEYYYYIHYLLKVNSSLLDILYWCKPVIY